MSQVPIVLGSCVACNTSVTPPYAISRTDSATNAGAIWAGEMAISGGNLSIEDSKASQENGGQGLLFGT